MLLQSGASKEALRTLIVGGRGGIGTAYGKFFNPANTVVTASTPKKVEELKAKKFANALQLDFNQEAHFKNLSTELKNMDFVPDLVINCTGVLGLPHTDPAKAEKGEIVRPESSVKKITPDILQRTFLTNVFANALLLRELASGIWSKAPKDHPLLFASYSARVGSIAANELGGWYSYRASKAAQNQLIKTSSLEFKRSHPKACLLVVHPGTVETTLSTPFVGNAKKQTLQSEVLDDVEKLSGYFTPDVAVQLMWNNVLSKVGPEDTGKFLDYAGQEIPW
ncbi:unnamed protein product [Amoebophrya sp. A120]|nr:unnamed protein product [Amoebophrya sp. A120]|eukprot:GSA120T00003161001.1